MTTKVVIMGAGPAGLLLAHCLLSRSNDYEICIYDKRSDPRLLNNNKRAFVIGISHRGQTILKEINGLWKAIKNKGIPVRNSGFYSPKKETWQTFSRYQHPEDCNLLINRNDLCTTLLEELEKRINNNLKIVFNTRCIENNFRKKTITLQSKDNSLIEESYDLLVGADGANSAVRNSLMSQPGFHFEQSYFNTSWKVLHLPRPGFMEPETSYGFREIENSTYIVGAALPEVNNQICLLIFWDTTVSELNQNPPGMTNANELKRKIKDVLLPGLELSNEQAEKFIQKRHSSVIQTKCNRYHDIEGKVVLVGDAAHAMSSRLGQGCQAAFNDVWVLNQLLQEENNNLDIVLPKYSEKQVKEGHAITDLNACLSPRSNWLMILFNSVMLLRSKLNEKFPNLIQPTPLNAVSRTLIPYSEIANRFQHWMTIIKWSNQRQLEAKK
ncbi:MAG: NAD(P)/FAD-dependent oxidoreductase [Crocosphaera sp.]|nr:NAD(P)/FAD-dependent oxidoreductase [Crocosphaera sp.]